jgi:DNA excision repair protein ERCC-5
VGLWHCSQLGLVDGVVTEDSDALLFGAATVYKNIFSDKKYVEVRPAL